MGQCSESRAVELVFAERNKEYGAYVIRKKYQRRILMALLYSVIGVIIVVGVPLKLMEVLSNVKFANKASYHPEPPPIDKTTLRLHR